MNILTKRGRHLKGTEVAGEVGSFDAMGARASYGTRFTGGSEILLSASHFETEGQNLYFSEFDDPNTNRGWAEAADGDRNTRVFVKTAAGAWSFEGGFSSRTKKIPTASFNTEFNDSGTRTTDEQAFLLLRFDKEFANDSRIGVAASYDNSRYQGRYVYPSGVLRDYGYGQAASVEGQYDINVRDRQRLVLGGEARYVFQQDQGAYDSTGTYLRDGRQSSTWAVYLQDEIQIVRRLALTAGIRHDHYDTFGGVTNPRIALIYGGRERTTFKLLYGTAFRAPTAYENYYHDGGYSQKASSDLRPETIGMYEAVVESSFTTNLRSSASLYRYNIVDLVGLRTDPSDGLLVFENGDRIRASGIEVEVEGRLARVLDGRLSYAYQSVEDASTHERVPNSPRSIAKANVRSNLWDGRFSVGMDMQYLSDRKAINGDPTGDYFVADLTVLGRPWSRGPTFSITSSNFFDAVYGDPGSEEHVQRLIMQDGRTYRLLVKYEF